MKGILAISGQPGLFKMVSEGKNCIIVESLLTGKRKPAYATARISALDDIAIFTVDGDMPLKDVFKSISRKENGGAAINHKASQDELIAYFKEVVPNYDEYQVRVADMKKVFQWYNLLQQKDLLVFDEEDTTEEN